MPNIKDTSKVRFTGPFYSEATWEWHFVHWKHNGIRGGSRNPKAEGWDKIQPMQGDRPPANVRYIDLVFQNILDHAR